MVALFTRRLIYSIGIALLTWVCVAVPNDVGAVTVTGTDIRIDYIGTAGPTDLTYRVFVVVYTQCDNSGSIALRPNIDITVSSRSNKVNMNMPLQRLPAQAGDTLSSVCPNVSPRNSCYDPALMNQRPGYIKTTYTGVISLPAQAEDWVFYYYHLGNGRGNTSVNLCESMIMHVAALCYFNNKIRYNNSSPRFTANPVTYLNLNQPSHIFNGPADPDLDSLVVRPTNSLGCLTFNGTSCPTCGLYSEISYLAAFSVNQPIVTNPPNSYFVNPVSGTASFTPAIGGSYAFGFKCEEYDRRTGALMGYVIRDIAVPVTFYTGGSFTLDSLPTNLIGGIPAPQGSSSLVVCPGTPLEFSIAAQSTGGSVYLIAERPTAPSSAFTITGNGSAAASGRFSWTPGPNDIGQHVILIKGVDSACGNAQYPYIHEKYSVITINVIAGIDAGPDKTYCGLSGIPMMIGPDMVIPGIGYRWTAVDGSAALYMDNPNIPTPKVMPSNTITYVLTTTGLPATCKQKDTITVTVDKTNGLTVTPPSPITLCDGELLELEAIATGPPPYQNFPCGLTGVPPTTPLDSVAVEPLGSGMVAGNNPQSTPFNAQTTSRHQYLVRASDLLAAGMRSGTLTGMTLYASGNGAGATFNDFRIHLKCTPLTSLDVNAFEQGSVPVYASNAQNIPASGRIDFNFEAWYNWDTTQNLIVEICFTKRTGNVALFTDVYPTVYSSCVYTSNATGNSVCGGGVGSAGPNSVNELPRMLFRYHRAPDAAFKYAWERIMGNYLSDTASRTPTVQIEERTKHYVYSYGRSGCLLRDSVDVYISTRDFKVSPLDTVICIGDTAILRTSGGYYYHWYENNFGPALSLDCDDCPTVNATPVERTSYTLVMSDSLRCADTFQLTVGVMEASNVKILNNDTTIKYGQSVQLAASGAERYLWSPALYLDNPAIANPLATPKQNTLYVVTGSTSGLCRSSDSVWIRVDYRGDLLIPSAFSPNGDGVNDRFKVENLTFQKIVQFRVFNRYGQEVYNAPMGNSEGWDGNWKERPGDMGTYFYHVEIAYPDGHTKSFKGDVTLIR